MTTEQVGGPSIFISCRERRRRRMAVERGPLSIVQKQRVRVGEIESVHKQAGPRQRVGGCASDGAWLGLARDATTLSDKVQYRFLPGEREERGGRGGRAPWATVASHSAWLQGPRLRIGAGDREDRSG
jgi:hypothetical protein